MKRGTPEETDNLVKDEDSPARDRDSLVVGKDLVVGFVVGTECSSSLLL